MVRYCEQQKARYTEQVLIESALSKHTASKNVMLLGALLLTLLLNGRWTLKRKGDESREWVRNAIILAVTNIIRVSTHRIIITMVSRLLLLLWYPWYQYDDNKHTILRENINNKFWTSFCLFIRLRLARITHTTFFSFFIFIFFIDSVDFSFASALLCTALRVCAPFRYKCCRWCLRCLLVSNHGTTHKLLHNKSRKYPIKTLFMSFL